MSEYPNLKWISVSGLIETAGDPWFIDSTLQSGDPSAINDLGRAFYSAAECTAATYQEFVDAQTRFRDAWNRGNADHPINDSAEVQRATTALMFQKENLPQVSTQLTHIATELAVAHRTSHRVIKELNNELLRIDDLIDQAIINNEDTTWLEFIATKKTAEALCRVQELRDDYSTKLSRAMTYLRAELNYDPAILEGLDGEGDVDPTQRGRDSTTWYSVNQRSKDEALANSPTADPAEKAEATARLHDYVTATDSQAVSESRTLATERIDDFRMANFVGPLPRDHVFGGDARDRARTRLDLQRKLQQGFGEMPPMAADQATRTINDGEHFGRVTATQRALAALRNLGMSAAGAQLTVSEIINAGERTALAEHPLKAHAAQLPGSRLERLNSLLSPSDAAHLGRIAGPISTATDVVTFFDAIYGKQAGGSWGEACSRGAGAVGGLVGGFATPLLIPAAMNPVTAVGVVFLGSTLLAAAGEELGAGICSEFDPVPTSRG